MPDKRKHRGPHPADAGLFGEQQRNALAAAVGDLSWLMSRGYANPSALKLVGDRYQLTERQRTAVIRSSCADASIGARHAGRVEAGQLAGRTLDIDGFNLLTSIEAALAGGVILAGRDGCYRDMASMHGSYRKVEETRPAIELIGRFLESLQPAACRWYFDRPVSNSGRISQLIREFAAEHQWPWEAQIVDDPDVLLRESSNIVVTADSAILDAGPAWFNLAREVIEQSVPDAHVVRFPKAETTA